MITALGIAALFALVAALWLAPTLVAASMGDDRNRCGWPWGLLLGWVGVAILACLGYLPSKAERQVRELEAERRLEELRRV